MDKDRIPRLEASSLKERCVETLERLIISGEFGVDELVPPERDLARRLGVSRPVVHEAMVELAAKGFVRVEPRRGARINDFWRHGTLAIFESVVLHSEGHFPEGVLEDMLAFRSLIELEAVRLAARSGGAGLLPALEASLAAEAELAREAPGDGAARPARAELDLRFHLLLVEASGSRVLPLVMNSTTPMHRIFIERFYASGPDLAELASLHKAIVSAIAARDPELAVSKTRELLDQGAARVRATLKGTERPFPRST